MNLRGLHTRHPADGAPDGHKHTTKITRWLYQGVFTLTVLMAVFAPVTFSNTPHLVSVPIVHAAELPLESTSCGGLSDMLVSPIVCSTRWTISVIASAALQLGATALSLSSGLFSMLVEKTIISFGNTEGILTAGAKTAINTAWTAFRDLSNIFIIAFFVFIAISIILGSSTFGQKKLIARVLIIAVLINFSLFFTQVIIDLSNYTATQFYKAAALDTPAAGTASTGGAAAPATGSGTTGTAATTPQATPDGIGDRFLKAMGITSYAQTKDTLNKITESQDSVGAMLVYTITMFAILIMAAFVLFYGCFILASRAILLVFLMITAALAFASHLLPDSYTEGKIGWGMWWRSLIQSAVLAPVLMLFLWVTLLVAENLKVSSAALGDITYHSTKSANITSLVSYFIILGLLFATFKVANSFSTSISGFNWSSVVPAIAVAGTARLAAWSGQRASINASRGLNAAANQITSRSTMANVGRSALSWTAEKTAALSQRSQNAMTTKLGATIASNVNRTGLNQKILAGKSHPPAQSTAMDAILKAVASKGPKPPPGGGPSLTPPRAGGALPAPATPPLPSPGATPRALTPPATPKTTPPVPAAPAKPPAEPNKAVVSNEQKQAMHQEVENAAQALQKTNEDAAQRRADETQKAANEEKTKEETANAVGAAVASAVGNASSDNTKQLESVLQKQGETTKASLAEVATQVAEGQKTVGENLESGLAKAAGEMKAATKETGAALAAGVEGVKQATQRAVEVQNKAIETKKDDKLMRDIEAERQHVASQKSAQRTIEENIRGAGLQAQEDTRRFANLRNEQQMKDFDTPSTGGSTTPTQMTPKNLGGSSGFAAQPYAQVPTQPHMIPAEIPLHQGAVDAEALLKQVRETRARLRDQLGQGSKGAPARGTQGSNPPHRDIPPMAA